MRVRRKLSREPSVPGSVVPEGQRITIRVITDQYLRVQKLYRYKLEVVSSDSPYHGYVSDFVSDIMLSAGHSYHVQLNDKPKDPRIVVLLDEVEDGAP